MSVTTWCLVSALLAQAPGVKWHYSSRSAFKEAAAGGRAVVVFSRTEWDTQSRWLAEHVLERSDVRALLPRYVCAQLWVADKLLRDAQFTEVGFAFFEPDRRLLEVVKGHEPVEALLAALARAHTRVGEADRLLNALKESPRDPSTLGKLIAERTRRREPKAAADLFKRLASIRPLRPEEAVERSYVELQAKAQAKDHKSAAALAEAFLAKHPASRHVDRAAAMGARAYEAQRQYDKAIGLLERALAIQPAPRNSDRLAFRIGSLHHALGRTAEANAAMARILKRWPASPTAAHALVRRARGLWLAEGKPRAASALLARVAEMGSSARTAGPRASLVHLIAERARLLAQAIECEPRWAAAGRTAPRPAGIVVLVPDLSTFLHCVSLWDANCFFPVLFDEPKFARKFVQAYGPAQVFYAQPQLQVELTQALVHRTVLAALGPEDLSSAPAAPPAAIRERWSRTAGAPAGVVVSSLDAAQLPAAVALAAGRRQILLLADPKLAPKGSTIKFEDKERLRGWLMASLREWGLSFEELGDSIDFVTLAAEWPCRYQMRTGIFLGVRALDDALTRRDDDRRFAFCGRIIGSQAQAAYMAMCSLFLKPDRGLLFDTYGGRAASIWRGYGMAQAAKRLAPLMDLTHLTGKEASLAEWHRQTMPLCRFGLVCVNSSGGSRNWSVPGGGGTTEDVPHTAPCMVHFTHSGSASAPQDPNSIAGRWLSNGAYLYFGALAEPYLSAFVPANEYAQRLSRGWPAGAAFRRLDGESFWTPWRLWLIGDPLAALHARRERGPAPTLHLPAGTARMAKLKADLAQVDDAGQRAKILAELCRTAFVLGLDAAASGRQCQTELLPQALAQEVHYVRLAALLAMKRLNEIERIGVGIDAKRMGPDAAMVWRTAVVTQLQAALLKRDTQEAMRRLRLIAATATHRNFLIRVVKGLAALCKTEPDRASLKALCSDLKQSRPKDKKLHQALDKIVGAKRDA